ncbi:hypothetical protein FALBO_14226 [Fusarium albosuccineum]|uniref:Uncharacterized protein n=1 Tax=Fusarium albosuccineum TaxID=1237068 RepID=A0A8H4KZ72_9HYPO|nr:hypothetical protein FALBO_14226 [Fusarium albosuccineum]
MADNSRFAFDLEDIANRRYIPTLRDFMGLGIHEVYVEFLQQGGRKPHVILRLVTHGHVPAVNRHGEEVALKACNLSMEYVGGEPDGQWEIRLTPYDDSSLSAGAGFRFPLRQSLQVGGVIAILQGIYPGLPLHHRSDLTHFNFVLADPVTLSVDGCRDIVSQWMIRLHTMGFMEWVADLQSVPRIVFNRNPPSYAFHDLIGYNYKKTTSRDRLRNLLVEVTPLPLDRGDFLDPRVQRIENYGGCQLPYNP